MHGLMVRGLLPSLFKDTSNLHVLVVHSVGYGRSFREYLVQSPFISRKWRCREAMRFA